MSPNRKLLGAAAFTLALTGGGVAGALLGTPSLSGAQDGTTSTTVASDAPATPDAARGGPLGHRGEALAVAAEALGIDEADLRTALEGGKSIADVAKDEGVDLQKVIDALVADGTERLNELEASLPDRITELVNRTGWGDHGPGGPGGPGRHHGARLEGMKVAADVIGISVEDLRTGLQGGSSLAEVAKAHDVDVQKVIDALVADATTHIDDAVAAGRLDADRAATMKANLVERITARVNGEDPGHPDDAVD